MILKQVAENSCGMVWYGLALSGRSIIYDSEANGSKSCGMVWNGAVCYGSALSERTII